MERSGVYSHHELFWHPVGSKIDKSFTLILSEARTLLVSLPQTYRSHLGILQSRIHVLIGEKGPENGGYLQPAAAVSWIQKVSIS